jgi:hypothetical protein
MFFARTLLALGLFGLGACQASSVPEPRSGSEVPKNAAAEAAPIDAGAPDETEPDAPPHKPPVPSPVFGSCVLHAGNVQVSRSKTPTGSHITSARCSYGAECVAHPGQGGPGDGFVDVSCDGTECECRTQPIGKDRTAAKLRFTLEEPCASSELAERALTQRCIPWTPPESKGWPKR